MSSSRIPTPQTTNAASSVSAVSDRRLIDRLRPTPTWPVFVGMMRRDGWRLPRRSVVDLSLGGFAVVAPRPAIEGVTIGDVVDISIDCAGLTWLVPGRVRHFTTVPQGARMGVAYAQGAGTELFFVEMERFLLRLWEARVPTPGAHR